MRSATLRGLLICLLTALMPVFNNCSIPRIPQSQDNNSQSPTYNNGGGHSGKVVYAFFADTPLCTQANSPESVIEIQNNQATLTVNQCSTSGGGQSISITSLIQNPYDPLYLVYDDSIYVNESVYRSSTAQRVVVDSLCYNSSRAIDFAVRYDKVFFNSRWQVTTIGHLITDSGRSGFPASLETVGRRPELPATATVRSPFISNDGKYRLDYGQTTNPSRGPGELTLETGEKIPVDCYILVGTR